ncbi:MAG TPA: polysaccharide biosynthesis/export family protein [Chthoniobacteraceae bacterium]
MRYQAIRLGFFLFTSLVTALCRCPAESAAIVLRPGDVFDLRLESVPDPYGHDFAGTFTVGEDGTVAIPHLKDPVKAAGATANGLGKVISDQLIKERIFAHPLAVVTLANQMRTVSVGGPGARAPGTANWTPNLTLRAAIDQRGGFTEYGNPAKIKISRGGKTFIVNLKKAEKDPSQNPKLEPDDEVEVPER